MKQGAFVAVVLGITLAMIAWWQFGGSAGGERQRPAQVVNVEQPRSAVLQRRVEAVGSARARQSVNITSEVDGRVARLALREGARVKAGDLLVALDDRTVRADLARADANLADARAAWQRASRLQDTRAVSEAEVDRLRAALQGAEADREAAASRLAYHQIRAPFAGVIGLRHVDTGSYVRAGDLITTLDDQDQLEVQFTVPERHLAALAVGQRVIARSDAWPDREFAGEVTQLDSRVDPVNRAITVKALLDNREQWLRPGQFLQVSLKVGEQQAWMIPEQAILTQGAVSFAFVAVDGKAERRELALGSREQGWVEIRQGINEGDAVIVTGHTRLGGGSPVQVVEDSGALVPESAGAFSAQEG
ncbi:MAG: efflux RND transporter periplasmic adaptor subunit [Alcanivoracaceae bacterium]